jgi:hypothetical protein
MAIRSVSQAKAAIQDEAAARAYAYLEREAPQTLAAITYLVNDDKWSTDQIMEYFEGTYGLTEEKTQHKVRLVANALVRERDND